MPNVRPTQANLAKLPDAPGVYFFTRETKNQRPKTRKKREILYIGKATSLRDRVRSYFSADINQTRGPLIEKMLAEATDIDYEETDSVVAALLFEAKLIKEKQPKYNTKEKSDTSFSYVVVTKEDYPRVFMARGKELVERYDPDAFRYTFGPFPHGSQLREALRIIRKIFPFRGEKDPVERARRGVSYLRREIGLTPDFAKVGKREYARTIQHLRLFFEGKKRQLLRELEKRMRALVKEERFEDAECVKRQLFALMHIRDVSLIKEEHSNILQNVGMRIEAYDVAHTAGTETVGVMVVLEDGAPKKRDYRKFKLSGTGGDVGALKELLERRLGHDEWPLPRLIVVDGAAAQENAARTVLGAFGYEIPVVAVTKDERHRPKLVRGAREYTARYERDIIIGNGEAHRFAQSFHRKRLGRRLWR